MSMSDVSDVMIRIPQVGPVFFKFLDFVFRHISLYLRPEGRLKSKTHVCLYTQYGLISKESKSQALLDFSTRCLTFSFFR